MQTRRKKKNYVQDKPHIDEAPKSFDAYLQSQSSQRYTRKAYHDISAEDYYKDIQALQNTVKNIALLNSILQNYEPFAERGSEKEQHWYKGLQQFQDAVNQIRSIQIENNEITEEELLRLKQVLESFNTAYKSSFSHIFERDWGLYKLIDTEVMALQDIQNSVETIGTEVFGYNIKLSDIRKIVGKYDPELAKKIQEQNRTVGLNRAQSVFRPDYGAIYKYVNRKRMYFDESLVVANPDMQDIGKMVNQHPSGKTTSGVDSTLFSDIDEARKKAKRQYNDYQRRRKKREEDAQQKAQEEQHLKLILQGVDEAQARRAQVQVYLQNEFGGHSSIEKSIDQMIQHQDNIPFELKYQMALAYFYQALDQETGVTYYDPAEWSRLFSRQDLDKLFTLVKQEAMKSLAITKVRDVMTGAQIFGENAIAGLNSIVEVVRSNIPDFNTLFDDIFMFPMNQQIIALGFATKGAEVAGIGVSVLVSSTVGMIKVLLNSNDNIKKKKGKNGEDEDDFSKITRPILQLAESMLSILESLLRILQSGIQLIQSVILNGLSQFISVFSQTMNFLRKILFTSKTIEQIQKILNLAMSIFFLPVNLVFGNYMFKQVSKIITWLNQDDGGQALFQTASQFADLQKPLLDIIDNEIVNVLPGLIQNICKNYPEFISLFINDIMPFVKYFCLFLGGENGEETGVTPQALSDFFKAGIEQADELVKNNIIGVFISVGKQCMGFIIANKKQIYKCLEMQFFYLDKQMDAVEFCVQNMEALCIAFGTAIGAFVGFINNLSFSIGKIGGIKMALAWVQLFGKKTALKLALNTALSKAGLQRIIIGGALGQDIGHQLYTEYFSFQHGGYIPPVAGGHLIRVAEKETEYIIPESKMHLIRGHNNILIEINGDVYGLDSMNEVVNAINAVSNRQRFR